MPLCVGNPNGLNLNEAEIEYRNKMKKFAILKNDVSKGDKLSSVEVCFKRVNLEEYQEEILLNIKIQDLIKILKPVVLLKRNI